MKYIDQRLFHTTGNPKGDYTLGMIQSDFNNYKAFSLEDTKRETKIPGETRFKANLYALGIRNELTPLTIKHRESYAKHPEGDWFRANPDWYHIEILNIPDYTGVYHHSGIDNDHTKGCVLHCYGFDLSKLDSPGSLSLKAVDDFYALTYPRLLRGEKIFWETRDEI